MQDTLSLVYRTSLCLFLASLVLVFGIAFRFRPRRLLNWFIEPAQGPAAALHQWQHIIAVFLLLLFFGAHSFLLLMQPSFYLTCSGLYSILAALGVVYGVLIKFKVVDYQPRHLKLTLWGFLIVFLCGVTFSCATRQPYLTLEENKIELDGAVDDDIAVQIDGIPENCFTRLWHAYPALPSGVNITYKGVIKGPSGAFLSAPKPWSWEISLECNNFTLFPAHLQTKGDFTVHFIRAAGHTRDLLAVDFEDIERVEADRLSYWLFFWGTLGWLITWALITSSHPKQH